MKIVVTGAEGLLGWHTSARLHAANCAARYRGDAEPYRLVAMDRASFNEEVVLVEALTDADAVLHFAGVNRGPDADVEAANPMIATVLADSIRKSGASPHVVYANSMHCRMDTPYGRSKRMACEILSKGTGRYTDLMLPHIFGECAKPHYNNVTATLIDQLWRGEAPSINSAGRVSLLHAGRAAEIAIDAVRTGQSGELTPPGRDMTIQELYDRLSRFHASYAANIFPELGSEFELALFNSYRTGGYPARYPMPMDLKRDTRGVLFEAAKASGPSQTFLSTTFPGQRRGDHFHTNLVERFLVVAGEATIRIRKVLSDEVQSFQVSGACPVAIDMPPLHTHHIENGSDREVVTYFWANRHFDPADPDTYADPVLEHAA